MDRKLGLRFADVLSNMEGKDYLEAMIAFSAAPTIKGKKPSSLITFNSHGKNPLSLWMAHGLEVCRFFQLEQFVLKREDNYLIVLLYRKKLLGWYVNLERNQPFLTSLGYRTVETLEQRLDRLKQRFETLCPHEVGIFLGMPVEDVEGFIEHQGQNCLASRYWKVYRNPQRAELLFNAYDQARKTMVEFIETIKLNRMAQYI